MIKTKLRDFVRDSPMLYRIYIRTRLGRILRLPKASTQLVLEGYPRSGNTFARYHLEAVYPDLSFTSHVHSRAALKLARKYGIFTIILMREPREAIASYCCKYSISQSDESGVGDAIQDYLHFYRYIERYQSDFELVYFENLVASPLEFLERVGVALNYDASRKRIVECCQLAKQKMLEREADKSPHGSSLPMSGRSLEKQRLYKVIEKDVHYDVAQKVYQALKKSCL